MTDDRGNPIAIGDEVVLTHLNSDRGAYMWMHKGTVVGFGRTRVKVQFPSRSDVSTVGGECLRVVKAPCPKCNGSGYWDDADSKLDPRFNSVCNKDTKSCPRCSKFAGYFVQCSFRCSACNGAGVK